MLEIDDSEKPKLLHEARLQAKSSALLSKSMFKSARGFLNEFINRLCK
jgi:hypothetical protein